MSCQNEYMIVYNRFFDYVTYVTSKETDFNQTIVIYKG